jgi:hypothetical protein
MSQQNQVAVKIADADLQNITKLITDLQAAIAPYVITLTAEDRKSLLKMSDKSVAFVNKNLGYTTTNPEFIPPYLSVPDFQTDADAVNQLHPLFKEIKQIADNLDDTIMLSGSEAYTGALLYYNSVKQAIKGNVPNTKTIYDDLSQRYPGRSSVTVTNNPEPAKS